MRLKDGISDQINNFKYLDRDTIIVSFFKEEYCDYLIEKLNKFGSDVDSNGNRNTYLHRIENGIEDCKDYLQVIKEKIEPEVVKNWTHVIKNRLWKYYPVPFLKKYSTTGQKKLNLHVDNSLLTFLVKLNDDYEGCNTIFPRQNWSTAQLNKGEMVICPGVVTHPHVTESLISGEKYSLIGRASILDVREITGPFDNIEDVIK